MDGLIEILKSNPLLNVSDVAYNGLELISLFENKSADLVILDINMPKMNGIQCTKWIKEHHPGTKVIILTMYPEKTYIENLIRVGADGCLLKSRGSIDLLDAIDRVLLGKSYFDWISDFRSDKEASEIKLSERELEIIKLITEGKTSSEIAELLFISEATVKTHRKNIFKKLKIHNTSELLNFVLNNGII